VLRRVLPAWRNTPLCARKRAYGVAKKDSAALNRVSPFGLLSVWNNTDEYVRRYVYWRHQQPSFVIYLSF